MDNQIEPQEVEMEEPEINEEEELLLGHLKYAGELLDAWLRKEEEEAEKELPTPEYWEIQGKKISTGDKVVYHAYDGDSSKLFLGIVQAVEKHKLVLSTNGSRVNLFPLEKSVAIVE